MLGRFLELAIATEDITVAAPFYEQLGFTPLTTGDAWPHRYGVFSDDRLHLGLHEWSLPSPALTFVLPDLQQSQHKLLALGEPELALFSEEQLHRLQLRDPGDQPLLLLEARTYSPAPQRLPESLLGYFSHLSLPESDFDAARDFWERAGFVALPEEDEPLPQLPLTSDWLDLAFHQRRSFDAPLIAFDCVDLEACRARVTDLELPLARDWPRGLDRKQHLLIDAPDGIVLWVRAVEN